MNMRHNMMMKNEENENRKAREKNKNFVGLARTVSLSNIRHIIIIIIVYLTYVYIFLSPLPSPSLSIFSPLFLPLSLFLCVYKKLSWLYITHSMPNATLNVHIPIIMYCKRFVHGDTRIEFRWNIRVGFAHCSCTCTIRRCLYTVRCSKTYVYTMFTRSQRYRYIYTY